MTVKECYEKIGANYEEVVARLMSDKLICKYNKRFYAANECDNLLKYLEEENYEEAFRMAHSMKGMCVNLAFDKLYKFSSELCEALRDGAPTVDIKPMVDAVVKENEFVLACIQEMDDV